MGLFDLPTGEVYVNYEDGRTECVAMQDSLSENEAIRYKEMWEHKGKIISVELQIHDKQKKIYRF